MWFYFKQDNIRNYDRINFGKWLGKESRLNRKYNNFIDRLCEFFLKSGADRYNRFFLAEPIIDFAIDKGIAECSIDYIYRMYVYHKLNEYEYLDIENAYLEDLFNEFIVIDEKDIAIN